MSTTTAGAGPGWPKLGAQNFMWASLMVGKDPSTRAISSYLPGDALAGNHSRWPAEVGLELRPSNIECDYSNFKCPFVEVIPFEDTDPFIQNSFGNLRFNSLVLLCHKLSEQSLRVHPPTSAAEQCRQFSFIVFISSLPERLS